MLAARTKQFAAGVAEGVFGVGEMRAAVKHEGGGDEASERPADGAEALGHRAVGEANPARALGGAGGAEGEDVRLRGDADEAVDGEHGDGEGAHAAGAAVEVEEMFRQRLVQPAEAAHLEQAERDEHEGEGNDEETLDEVRVSRRHQAAEEAIEDDRGGHGDDDAVGGDHFAAGGHGDDLASAFEHHALTTDEKRDGEEGVGERELAAVTVLDDFRDGGALAAAIPRCQQPVEGRDEHVLPLEPNRGEPHPKRRAGLRHRLFRVRAGAERLADHDPPRELALAKEIAVAGAGLAGEPEAEGRDADEVSNQHGPIQHSETGSSKHEMFSFEDAARIHV